MVLAQTNVGLFETVLVPTLVAATVTTLLEVFAKPWWAVRAESIAERRRALRALRRHSARLGERLWPLYRLGHIWDDERTPGEVEDALATLSAMRDALADAAAERTLPNSIPGATIPALLDMHAYLVRVRDGLEGEMDARGQIRSLHESLFLLPQYLDLRSYRLLRRRRLLALAEEAIEP